MHETNRPPRSIDLEITEFCNFRCRMCPHSIIGNDCSFHMAPTALERLLSVLPDVSTIQLQGDGEPLMHPEFAAIIKSIAKKGPKLILTTNLSLLDEGVLNLFDEYFKQIIVSCDASSKELYESIRRGGDYLKFLNNMERLTKHLSSDKIALNCVLMRQNIQNAKEMVLFAHGHGVRNLVFSDILTMPELKNEADSLSLYPILRDESILAARDKAVQLGINLSILIEYGSTSQIKLDGEDHFSERNRMKEAEKASRAICFDTKEKSAFAQRYERLHFVKKTVSTEASEYRCKGRCYNLFEKAYIDVHGNMTACCFSKTSPVGSLIEEDFFSIWNGSVLRGIRALFDSGRLPKMCLGCKYAISVQNNPSLKYRFKIANIDTHFFSDKTFWENRDI